MSESSTKKTRKSKLVPRECGDSDDDNVMNLQANRAKLLQTIEQSLISVKSEDELKGIKTIKTEQASVDTGDDFEALIDSETKPTAIKEPSREFSVTVAVEEFDEDSSDLIIDEDKNRDHAYEAIDEEQDSLRVALKKRTPSKDSLKLAINKVTSEKKKNVIDKTQLSDELRPDSPLVVARTHQLPKILSECRVYSHSPAVKARVYPEIPAKHEFSNADLSETYVLNREAILKVTDNIMKESTAVADKILCIEVKNCLGRFQLQNRDNHDEKLQKVFDQWQEWQMLLPPKYRTSPLFYKCYICRKAWWYLSNFVTHLKEHDEYLLELEEYTFYEANVIAYKSVEDIKEIKHFSMDGECPQCGHAYPIHKSTNRRADDHYTCRVIYCLKSFPTCYLLKCHENTSHTTSELTGIPATANQWKKTCEICSAVCHSQIQYRSHMTSMHTVRSDIIVPVSYSKCKFCQTKYVNNGAHDCPKKGVTGHCYCFRLFPIGLRYNTHRSSKTDSVKCRICGFHISRSCLETEHILMFHSDKFVIVRSCMLCENYTVFLDDPAATQHVLKEHHSSISGSLLKFFDKILIPKLCLLYNQENGEDLLQIAIKDTPIVADAPKLEIKQEIIDELPIADPGIIDNELPDEENRSPSEDTQEKVETEIVENFVIEEENPEPVKIKQELIDIEENDAISQLREEENVALSQMQENIAVKLEPRDDVSRIFGIKIEPKEVKQEMQDEEDEYEDDIIRLDFNFMQTPVEEGTMQVTQDDMQEDMEMPEDMQDAMLVMQESTDPKIKTPNLYKCHRCLFVGVHKDFRKHMKEECDMESFNGYHSCTKCATTYKSFRKYLDHFTRHGLNLKCCPVCFRSFEEYSAYLSHVSMHIRTNYVSVRMITTSTHESMGYKYQCKVCSEYLDKSDFFFHWELHLTIVEGQKEVEEVKLVSQKPYDNAFVKKLLDHLQNREMSDKMHPGCFICQKHFKRRNDCKRHLIEHLLNDAYAHRPDHSALKCQICGKTFQKPESYKKHMRDHASLPIYKCEICDKTFSDSSNFTKHKKLHNINAYTCDSCGKKFQAKISIERHMKIHETQKPVSCKLCNKIFPLLSTYKKHIRMQHDNTTLKYRCIVCSIKFGSLKEKWDHMWAVHKERKYNADCLICNKSFRRYMDLKNHVKQEHQDLETKKLAALQASTKKVYDRLRRTKTDSKKKNIYDLLKSATIVDIRSNEETLVVYE